jgi:phosphoglycerate-specific signal transduction histidine kinase
MPRKKRSRLHDGIGHRRKVKRYLNNEHSESVRAAKVAKVAGTVRLGSSVQSSLVQTITNAVAKCISSIVKREVHRLGRTELVNPFETTRVI